MTDEIEIDQIVDVNGLVRRLGSLLPPEGFVSSFQTFESEFPVWDDADIRKVITDPNRTPRRRYFGDYWIMDQKSHGSCNGFAIAAALSKARKLRGIFDDLLLSGAFAYSTMNGGRDQGSALENGLRNVQSIGICPADLVTWDMIYPNQQPRNAKAEAAKHKGLKCYAAQTLQGFRTGIAAGFVGVIAIHAGSRFQRLDSRGIAGVDNGPGNHAIHCDDLAMVGGVEVFDAVNSWNLGYGTRGRAYLTKDSFSQTFGKHTFYLVASTEEKE